MRVHKTLRPFTFPLLMSVYMVTLMTALITWLNIGFGSDYLHAWGQAFLFAWPIAFVLILLGAPKLQALTAYLHR